MGLLVTNNLDATAYVFAVHPGTNTRIPVVNPASIVAVYLDRDDRCIGYVIDAATEGLIWDPNLIDSTSSRVGAFDNPLSNATNIPFLVSDYEPATNDQRLFSVVGPAGTIQELLYNDPEQILDADPFPKIDRGGPDDFAPGVEGNWQGIGFDLAHVFFPGIDFAIVLQARVWIAGPTAKSNVVGAYTISTGFGRPLNQANAITGWSVDGGEAIGRYAAGENEFNRGQIFAESAVNFNQIQFIPDSTSTHAQPRGELFLWGSMTDLGGGDGALYVQFVDFDPFNLPAVEGVTPSRVHLRQTLLSRVVVKHTTTPVGDPPVPLNGFIVSVASTAKPTAFFTNSGSKRMHFVHADQLGPTPETWLLQVGKGAIPSLISVPSPKGEVLTNRQVTYQAEVLGDLSELINGAVVTWTIARGSTQAEVLATTPSLGETVVVANFPIDRDIVFPPGFAVLKDAVEMTEGGGAGEYTVVEATGSITFGAAEPVAGPVYRCRYAHPTASATPAHGTVVDPSVFTTVLGVAQTRVTYPDDDTLAGHIDIVTASTPT